MRCALYFAPAAGGALERFGASWLGRDAATGKALDQPELSGLEPAAFRGLTSEPRRYGFHATLKAPFALAAGRGEAELLRALERFASGRVPFSLRLAPAALGSFLALRPVDPSPALADLAAAAVTAFDAFRAPPTPAERARRLRHPLTPNQLRLLDAWGYPYVFEEFRFHMTLTNSIPDADLRARLLREIGRLAGPLLAHPIPVREVCLFIEPEPAAPFRLVRRFPFPA